MTSLSISAAEAFLTSDVRARPNLEIRDQTLCHRVGFDGDRATHVEVEGRGAEAGGERHGHGGRSQHQLGGRQGEGQPAHARRPRKPPGDQGDRPGPCGPGQAPAAPDDEDERRGDEEPEVEGRFAEGTGVEAQQLFTDRSLTSPLHPDVVLPSGTVSAEDISLIDFDPELAAEQREAVLEQWGQLID